MACLITSGIAKGCKDSLGGIKTVYLANWTNVGTISPTYSTDTTGIITGMTMSGGTKFYEFVPNKMSSNWVENVQSNVQNGTIAYEQVLTLMLGKNQAATRNQIKLIGQAEVMAIVLDRNEKYWLLGERNGLELSGGNGGSGTAMTDMNGWNLSLSGSEQFPAREIADSTVVASVL